MVAKDQDVFEMSVSRKIAQEDFIGFRHCKSYRSYIIKLFVKLDKLSWVWYETFLNISHTVQPSVILKTQHAAKACKFYTHSIILKQKKFI